GHGRGAGTRRAGLDPAGGAASQWRERGIGSALFAEVMAAKRTGRTAVVAAVGDELVGMAVARAHGERGWILLVAPPPSGASAGSAAPCSPSRHDG
ncbi:hypothetical protein ACIPSA_09170, partial [Streptomyces sp. NPDC086549]